MFYEMTAEKLGLTESELLGNYYLTVYGGRGVHVEGHKGISYLSEEEIVVKQKKAFLKIRGKGLKLREISPTDAYISGKVSEIIIGGDDV